MDLLLAYFGGILTGVLGVVLWAACMASVPTVPGAHVFEPDDEEDPDDSGGPDLSWLDEETLVKWRP